MEAAELEAQVREETGRDELAELEAILQTLQWSVASGLRLSLLLCLLVYVSVYLQSRTDHASKKKHTSLVGKRDHNVWE